MTTIEQWVDIFSKTDASNISAEKAIATQILLNTDGYRINTSTIKGNNMFNNDIDKIANAIQAYARMCQEVGLKV